MKLFLSICLFWVLSIPSFAGDKENPVSWKVTVQATNKEHTEYQLTAKATIEKGFHIWALDAGGDGSLINTAIELQTPSVSWKSDTWASDKEAHKETLEFIEGPVFSFEKSVSLTRVFSIAQKTKKIKGTITYQTCNESMCLPPEDFVFELDLP
ncbi:protein-disulfide reductase DsbD domain-containing protein [Taibaiella sp. KBW10]|uniref:protein-disulfide reductase DsbD domain-containing protein n=1 Tax=Taibaiella sp. KBW10 TaxID=2153357 RepID=UPI0013153F06|nr:protein-disulfide reductase DsbD domain-containing protein [Taibaiella sp. KBW10]